MMGVPLVRDGVPSQDMTADGVFDTPRSVYLVLLNFIKICTVFFLSASGHFVLLPFLPLHGRNSASVVLE